MHVRRGMDHVRRPMPRSNSLVLGQQLSLHTSHRDRISLGWLAAYLKQVFLLLT